ncbi:cobalt-precorrin-5B (C(1))-methyltransferase CbiD [Lentilactobacillus sp. IMAU92037]|uniref:cobalt-precorrin-5B (C(1))-methyltransferase CbiD n=1 Tax=Lentilactobacillus dabitei TaxID=2831523 RepID=UPI001C2C5BE8|nr:cobalt-precorrin-5B (C(1))-methyltransferase CbiD [Lentilactobacillus dabitei]MBV0930418.1 cobalt-precorrin-5B (C(1))-methyltransferase CbiD [Lentilactobacillus dabitei]
MAVDDFVFYNGRKLRKGFTTGTTATAASVAALTALLDQKEQAAVSVQAANGQNVTFTIEKCDFDKQKAAVAIKKDGGDDQDATDGMLIYSTVNLRDDNQINLDGGKGIGRVTQEGLPNKPGMPAINPTPRKMIKQSVRKVLGPDRGADVIISAPEGERVAKLTYNPKLGIVGGISILGTSGIVTPMSEDSWKASISIEMNIHKKRGDEDIILTPGDAGEAFAKEKLGLPAERIVQMSNFVGYVLKEAQRIGFKRVLIVGDLGKLIKVSGGIFSTHSKDADARAEIMVANLALLGAPTEMLQRVYKCLTTISMLKIVEEDGYQRVLQVIVDKIKDRSQKYIAHREPKVDIDAVIYSNTSGVLASTIPAAEIGARWK